VSQCKVQAIPRPFPEQSAPTPLPSAFGLITMLKKPLIFILLFSKTIYKEAMYFVGVLMDKNEKKANNVMKAMMKMSKINIKELQEAYDAA
jgi:hypothetical protein